MQQNYQTTKTAGAGANVGSGYPPNASWTDPSGVTGVGDPAAIGFFEGGQPGDTLAINQFGFDLPDFAVVDGVSIEVTGSQTGSQGSISLSEGVDLVDVDALNQSYGGPDDLWGASSIAVADVNDSGFGANIDLSDVSGGDGVAEVSLVEITVFWHIDLAVAEIDVPGRVVHKVYSRDGEFLGELPKKTSPLAFSQDINSAGSSLEITCGVYASNETTSEPLLTDDDEEILTDNDLPILADFTDAVIEPGNSNINAIFKNSNRIKSYVYNYWHPNGKLVFSGQVNKVSFQYGSGSSSVQLLVLSDGLDLSNFIARGYPFAYTQDVSQTVNNTSTVTSQDGKGAGWTRYGQTFRTGAGVENIGSLKLKMKGTATVTVSIYDAPNGTLLGSVTKPVSVGGPSIVQFDFPTLITLSPETSYFFALSVSPGQSITTYHSSANPYADGKMYVSEFSGGSGGGSWTEVLGGTRDMYFITYHGVPTTTTTYSSQDPITGMMRGILLDYNARGGYVTERNFTAAGYTLTREFNMDSIYDAMRKALEIAPSGYYSYIDLGTAEMDILPTNALADYTIVRGKDVSTLDISMSIEQVKNYFLFTGGEVSPDVNLFRQYQDTESTSLYGLRTGTKTDNRVTQTATADAVGDTFIEENSDEVQATTVRILNTAIDISLLTPGKTIGFRGFGGFIDGLVLQIVRREPNFTAGVSDLTLGRLPVTMSAEIQRLNRELLEEQTSNNPTAPS